jgi:hypothetical protein
MNHLTEMQLNQYLDDALSPTERAGIEKHLAGCTACKEELASLQHVFTLLGGLTERPLGHDLSGRVLARLPNDHRPTFSWRWVFAVEAGIALGMLVTFIQATLSYVQPESLSENIARAAVVLWSSFSNMTLRFTLPQLDVLPSLTQIPTIDLPLRPENVAVIVSSITLLWLIGNASLLRNGREVRK